MIVTGSRLGPYEILGPLGAGGMGEVYRARDARLQREVAIKVLPAELDSDPFQNSMGVHRGPTVKVQLRFHSSIAAAVRERTWHTSQQLKDRPDGGVSMTLNVSDDYALRAWILGFGRYVRVVSPGNLADSIQEECDAASTQYAKGHDAGVTDSQAQPGLPFLFNRLASA